MIRSFLLTFWFIFPTNIQESCSNLLSLVYESSHMLWRCCLCFCFTWRAENILYSICISVPVALFAPVCTQGLSEGWMNGRIDGRKGWIYFHLQNNIPDLRFSNQMILGTQPLRYQNVLLALFRYLSCGFTLWVPASLIRDSAVALSNIM